MRKILIVMFVLASMLMLPCDAFSQKAIAKEYFDKGKGFYDNGKYEDGIAPFRKALVMDKDNYNMKLSHDRSRSVRDYIVKAGIDPNRVQAKGYGESSPIASNDADEDRKANRRTEFIILEF
jgi:hypothetical protein